jgi:16S rRNA (guanine527-N7)-methyltransferase
MTGEAGNLLCRCAGELNLALPDEQLSSFLVLMAELRKWNSKFNLTSINKEADIALKHFVDSLLLLTVVRPPGKLLDIGSGGGFPSLPLKIMLPELDIVSVDAVEKKILFQRHMARLLGFQAFSALHSRVERLPGEYLGEFDWIVTRAFSDLPTFATLGLPYLKENGSMIAMKGKRGAEEARAAEGALAEKGILVRSCLHQRLPVSGDERFLVVMQRITGRPPCEV